MQAISERPMDSRQPIRVFVAEDHQITLWGLQRLIEASRPRMEVVGTATTRQELLNHDAAPTADVILLDLDLAGEDSTESLSDLQRRCPGHVLVLTGADDIHQHRGAVMRGARGVVHKSEPAENILRAIERVQEGEVWLQQRLMAEVLNGIGRPGQKVNDRDEHAAQIASLTPRERTIVSAIVRNAGAKQFAIADQLGMSEHTLRNHLTAIYAKLHVRGRLELHIYATEHGLVVPS
jgi:two-component system nitrate/nitrite response regulator NarL